MMSSFPHLTVTEEPESTADETTATSIYSSLEHQQHPTTFSSSSDYEYHHDAASSLSLHDSMPLSPSHRQGGTTETRPLQFPAHHSLYGREFELQKLEYMFETLSNSSTTANNVQICLLEGYSGVGKSALVQEFIRRQRERLERRRSSSNGGGMLLWGSGKYQEYSLRDTAAFPQNDPTTATASIRKSSSHECLLKNSSSHQELVSLSAAPSSHDDEEDPSKPPHPSTRIERRLTAVPPFPPLDGSVRKGTTTSTHGSSSSSTSTMPYSGIAQAMVSMTKTYHTTSMSTTRWETKGDNHDTAGAEDNDDDGDEEDVATPCDDGAKVQSSDAPQDQTQDNNDEDDDDVLTQDDIRLLIDIAPDLAPFFKRYQEEQQQQLLRQEGLKNNNKATATQQQPQQEESIHTTDTKLISNKRRLFQHSASSSSTSGMGRIPVDKSRIAMVVATFFRILVSSSSSSRNQKNHNKPRTTSTMILFLDDLQWMDAASLELLQTLWKDKSLPKWMFIGAARPSNDQRPSTIQMILSWIDQQRQEEGVLLPTEHISVESLSPKHIRRFVADTLEKKDYQEIEPLSQFVYSQCMGNIFLCRQVLEALVRRNVIYFGYLTWQFKLASLTHLQQDDLFGHDHDDQTIIVWMIQDKLRHLQSHRLRCAIIVAAYIRPTLDDHVLLECLANVIEALPELGFSTIEANDLSKILEQGTNAGLFLSTIQLNKPQYRFVHDRVMEAAFALVPQGSVRERFRGSIAKTLLEIANERTDDHDQEDSEDTFVSDDSSLNPAMRPPSRHKEWMVFVAVDHLNAISFEHSPCDVHQYICANYQVGVLCLGKACFSQAVQHFRILSGCIQDDIKAFWENHYQCCLDVFTRLFETEFVLGNYHETEMAIDTVLQYARCVQDKVDAHHTMIRMLIKSGNDIKYSLGVTELARLLAEEYDQVFPVRPTDSHIQTEREKFQVALGDRPLSCIAQLPVMKDDREMKLLAQLVTISNEAGMSSLHLLACLRFIRLSLNQGVSKYLLIIMTEHATSIRREGGDLRVAYSYASVVHKLYERFPGERRAEFAMSRMILHSGMLHLVDPFVESMEAFLVNYRMALAAGSVDIALSSAMHYPLIYFASGLPMNNALESKLVLFENKARHFARPGFVAIFRLGREFRNRLHQGVHGDSSSSSITAIDDEAQICSNLQGNSLKMTLRDSAILRIMSAFVFGDEEEMESMMTRLDEHPLFDLPLVRQHLRLTFHGLSCLFLGRKRGDPRLTEKGQRIALEMKKLSDIGSFNAQPAYLCLIAMEQDKSQAYDDAITACEQARFLHLEAIMNEHCALYFTKKAATAAAATDASKSKQLKYQEQAQDYMENALWLYRDWGAEAKARQLCATFEFGNVGTTHDIILFESSSRRPSWEANSSLKTKDLPPSSILSGSIRCSHHADEAAQPSSLTPPSIPRRSSSNCFLQDME